MTRVAILLAAGGGTRFAASAAEAGAAAAHKLLAELDGRPVHRHALDHVRDAAIGPVVVVTGAVGLDLPDDVVTVHNPDWAEGQATSLQAGLRAATSLGADVVLFGLADQPGVPAAAWQMVAAASPEWPIVVASYDGRRGPHPVRLHRSVWERLPASGDAGARTLLADRGADVHEVACPGSNFDIDTLEDLQRWKSS